MNKTWLITGCSSGIGRSLASEALKQGYNVVVTARDKEKIIDLVNQYPQNALALSLDVTNEENINHAIKDAMNY